MPSRDSRRRSSSIAAELRRFLLGAELVTMICPDKIKIAAQFYAA
jgi:hypothetical protein